MVGIKSGPKNRISNTNPKKLSYDLQVSQLEQAMSCCSLQTTFDLSKKIKNLKGNRKENDVESRKEPSYRINRKLINIRIF